MSEDVLELQNEVDMLNKRISVLEKKENRRRSLSYSVYGEDMNTLFMKFLI